MDMVMEQGASLLHPDLVVNPSCRAPDPLTPLSSKMLLRLVRALCCACGLGEGLAYGWRGRRKGRVDAWGGGKGGGG